MRQLRMIRHAAGERALALAALLLLPHAAFASLVPTIPEPGTMSLLGAAAVAAVIGQRFFRNK